MANFIHPTAIIGDNVILGDNNYIGAYCIIGDQAEHKKYWLQPKGKVIIGNGNMITGLVTIDAGTSKVTTIGDNCFIMKHSYIAHDCIIHSNVTISSGVRIGGHCIVKEYSNLGMNAVLHQFAIIEQGCMIGASAFFKGTSQEFSKYAGVPAKYLSPNIIKK
jgi:UDP-N-acetylglucosamine acyltransferase